MILGQVGEGGGGELHARHALQRERVRRHLHHTRAIAGINHAPEGALQVDALGGGALDRLDHPADPLLDRSQQSRPQACRVQHRVDQVGGCGLAVGARHPHHLQQTAGMAVDGVGGQGHRHPGGLHQQLWHRRLQRPLHDQRRRAAGDGLCGIVVPVAAKSRHTGVEGTRFSPIRAVGDRVDLRITVPELSQRPDRVDQRCQPHQQRDPDQR